MRLDQKESSGPHTMIKHPVACIFWRKVFDWTHEVPWTTFWDVFPDHLSKVSLVPGDEDAAMTQVPLA